MFGQLVLLGLATTVVAEFGDMTINQAIQESASSSKEMDFLQDNNTLMVELDMIMSFQDWQEYRGNANGRQKRKAFKEYRWTDNTIYYEKIPFDENDRQAIMSALDDYHRYTCIKFKPYQGGDTHGRIYFENGRGCKSRIGMHGGRQPVTLARYCRNKGGVIHELGHAVGLVHEQTRSDRDDYVTIHFKNVPQHMAFNFEKRGSDNLGVPYSYLSVMHYDQYAFSTNGFPSITTKKRKYQNKIGQLRGFDFYDIQVLNVLYECSSHCPKTTCPSRGFLGKDCKCWCPGNPVTDCSKTTGTETEDDDDDEDDANWCQDENRYCWGWAQKGYCKDPKHGYSMRVHCQRSCGVCTSKRSFSRSDSCIDQLSLCPQWAKDGECETNPVYMKGMCRKSCNSCRRSFSRRSCHDVNPACESWAQKGMCEQNKSYMEETCGKSCNPECKGKN